MIDHHPLCHIYNSVSVFFMSSYGAPLAQRASYLALHSSLFGPVYIVTNSINSLLIGSRSIPNEEVFPMAHALTIVEPIWPMRIKNSVVCAIDIIIYIHLH